MNPTAIREALHESLGAHFNHQGKLVILSRVEWRPLKNRRRQVTGYKISATYRVLGDKQPETEA